MITRFHFAGEPGPEGGTFTDGTFKSYFSFIGFYDGFANREPQTGSLSKLVELFKTDEDARFFTVVNTDSAICNRQEQTTFRRQLIADAYKTGRSIFNCVGNEIT